MYFKNQLIIKNNYFNKGYESLIVQVSQMTVKVYFSILTFRIMQLILQNTKNVVKHLFYVN